ncbi:MAG TPA: CpsD/CapB family tyrosine-protein kinase [Acidobacteriaceae bacterium]|jgi:capsular exopolysaccharide synthesis family protein|nr:CpsD/CapB family tyrosine-protein kinase [Acidobacteriaceae bacterium]
MSQIFDALQRAEAERAGTRTVGTSDAAELLERAERQAAHRREAIVAFGTNSTPPLSETDGPATTLAALAAAAPALGRGEPSVATLVEALAEPIQADAEKNARLLEMFRPVTMAPGSGERLVSLMEGANPAAEAFRLLAVRLRHRRKESTLRKLLITSTIPDEGKSVVSANLSCALAAGTRQKVLLVGGDIRRPSLERVFGIDPGTGLCELLEGSQNLASSVYHLKDAGIWVLPAGRMKGNALEILQSNKLPVLMEQLVSLFDWVVIDSPPILPLADTSVWARLADGVLLVARPGVTKKRLLEKGLEAIDRTKVVGALLNSYRSVEEGSYYYYGTASGTSGS